MILEILISTMNDNRDNINKIILPERSDVKYLVINQLSPGAKELFTGSSRSDVRVINFHEHGISRSRNRAIKNSIGDIALITDNDVRFRDDFLSTIIKAFNDISDADIITFQIETFPGEPPYKKYSEKFRRHTIRTIGNISSVEIAFKPEKIKEKGIKFNEKFGMGSPNPFGEENLFMIECLKKKLNMYYMPAPIVIHKHQSTMRNFKYTQTSVQTIGAIAAAKFGFISVFRSVITTVKKYYEYKKDMNVFLFFLYFQKGIWKYLLSLNKHKPV
jgi:glycosyltransferase involved in cell wall biosynthesis